MRWRRRTVVAVLLLASIAAAGCGTAATTPIPPSSRLVHVPGSSTARIILSELGAQRIGIQVSRARVAGAPAAKPPARGHREVTVPYSAVVYAPSGKTYLFSNPARLTYSEVPITISHIDGQVVFLSRGPKPGTRIVTVGAEELYGVQSGVLAQT